MRQNDELHKIILHASDEQLKALYKQYDKRLNILINSSDSTEEEVNFIADKLLMLSMVVDTTAYQPMELNAEYSNNRH